MRNDRTIAPVPGRVGVQVSCFGPKAKETVQSPVVLCQNARRAIGRNAGIGDFKAEKVLFERTSALRVGVRDANLDTLMLTALRGLNPEHLP